MSLVVITGPVRSGKSAAAERLAASLGSPVVVCASGWQGDEEMRRRIRAHRGERPEGWETREVDADRAWVAAVPHDAVLVLDCMATLVGQICYEAVGESEMARAMDESGAKSRVDGIINALMRRTGDTIIVTNEVGWGVVPPSASGRLFRDLLGRANRALIDKADAAYLVVDGRYLDLKTLPSAPAWPTAPRKDRP
ncbi:MAG: bifunctional adenosylcobinamide kinase/adenosylcobinamide-phosphate guanylyltransferase [Coriobacteriia bacterium]|nr:bifunctional adenosylcobinamide kinase/adenosylcobinamide-phosphate guanylyltransferase [Coriobacteriia bacterium]